MKGKKRNKKIEQFKQKFKNKMKLKNDTIKLNRYELNYLSSTVNVRKKNKQ